AGVPRPDDAFDSLPGDGPPFEDRLQPFLLLFQGGAAQQGGDLLLDALDHDEAERRQRLGSVAGPGLQQVRARDGEDKAKGLLPGGRAEADTVVPDPPARPGACPNLPWPDKLEFHFSAHGHSRWKVAERMRSTAAHPGLPFLRPSKTSLSLFRRGCLFSVPRSCRGAQSLTFYIRPTQPLFSNRRRFFRQ